MMYVRIYALNYIYFKNYDDWYSSLDFLLNLEGFRFQQCKLNQLARQRQIRILVDCESKLLLISYLESWRVDQ